MKQYYRRDNEHELVRKALERCEQRGAVAPAVPELNLPLELRVEVLEASMQVMRQEIERLKNGN